MRFKTLEYPEGRDIIFIGNDITFHIGSFGPGEDLLYLRASELARAEGIPKVYLAANSGARIGLAEEIKHMFQVAWVDPEDPHKVQREAVCFHLTPAVFSEGVTVPLREWGKTLALWVDSTDIQGSGGLVAKSRLSMSNSCDPVDCSPSGSSVHGILQVRILEWVTMPSPEDLSDPGIQPAFLMSPALAGGFFTISATWEALTPQPLANDSGSLSVKWK